MLPMGVAGSLIIRYSVRTFISSAGSQDILTACSVPLWDASCLNDSDYGAFFNTTLPPYSLSSLVMFVLRTQKTSLNLCLCDSPSSQLFHTHLFFLPDHLLP